MERPMKLLTILLVNTLTGSGFIFDNKHTLRFDGEVNIGKSLPVVLISYHFVSYEIQNH